jgi:hypothetical protein
MFYGEYAITTGLKFRSSLGIDYLATELRDVAPYWVRGVDINSPVRISEQRNNTYNWLAEQTLTYENVLEVIPLMPWAVSRPKCSH